MAMMAIMMMIRYIYILLLRSNREEYCVLNKN
jgi:hypothetical protein